MPDTARCTIDDDCRFVFSVDETGSICCTLSQVRQIQEMCRQIVNRYSTDNIDADGDYILD